MTNNTNIISYELVTAPVLEPVSAKAFKDFARLDDDVDDSYLNMFIKAARMQAEQYIGKAIITQTWKLRLDYFPAQNIPNYSLRNADNFSSEGYGVPSYLGYWPYNDYVFIAKPTVQSITSVVTYDASDNATTMSASAYRLDAYGQRLVLNQNSSWPINLRARAAIEITFVSGFGGESDDVPDDIQLGILSLAKKLYDCRGTTCDDTSSCLGILKSYKDYGRRGL